MTDSTQGGIFARFLPNYSLSSSDHIMIKQSLDCERVRLAKIRDLMDDHRLDHERSAQLRRLELSVWDLIQRHLALLRHSPIRSLPDEILSEILMDFSALQTKTALDLDPHAKIPVLASIPYIISLVNRWNSVVKADSRLWRAISVEVPDIELTPATLSPEVVDMMQKVFLTRLRIRVKRARSHPFSLTLYVLCSSYLSRNTFDRLFNIVAPQCRCLSVYLGPTYGERKHRLVPKERFTRLREVEVHLAMPDGLYTSVRGAEQWTTAICKPGITSLKLRANGSVDLRPWNVLELRNLRSFDAYKSNISLHDFLHLLRFNLGLLELIVGEVLLENAGFEITVVHQSLHSLCVAFGMKSPTSADLFDFLTLPQLGYLTVSHLQMLGIPSWTEFFGRSNCRLKGLAIYNADISPAFIDILQNQPRLMSLTFCNKEIMAEPSEGTEISSTLLSALADSQQQLCANLDTIALFLEMHQCDYVRSILQARFVDAPKNGLAKLMACEIGFRIQHATQSREWGTWMKYGRVLQRKGCNIHDVSRT